MQVTLVDDSESVSPQDRGLIYGDGFFTTARIAQHRILFWDDHKNRLITSAKRLLFNDFRIELLESYLTGLPEAAVVRICLTRGTGPRGYAIPIRQDCRCLIQFFDAPALDPISPKTVKVTLCQTPISENSALAGIKHLSRLDHVLARTEAEHRGFDEGLMLARGNLVCATQANLYVCRNNVIATPRLDKYGVEGTMKQNIQRWCRSLGLKMVECDLCAADLENCDEVFLSNSVFGIMSVRKIDTREMGQLGIARSMYQKFISNVK